MGEKSARGKEKIRGGNGGNGNWLSNARIRWGEKYKRGGNENVAVEKKKNWNRAGGEKNGISQQQPHKTVLMGNSHQSNWGT